MSGSPAVNALLQDQLALTGNGIAQFVSPAVGQNKAVRISGFSLAGVDGQNYALQLPMDLRASILPPADKSNILVTTAPTPKILDAPPSGSSASSPNPVLAVAALKKSENEVLAMPAGSSPKSLALAPSAAASSLDAPVVMVAKTTKESLILDRADNKGFLSVIRFEDIGLPAQAPALFNLPSDTFIHSEEGTQVPVQVKMADGSRLPDWLTYDPNSRSISISGAPVKAPIEVSVIGKDRQGKEASTLLRFVPQGN
ncbi:MAG: YDG domain-containing protein [Burkholderiales bacterium]|nr:YDG domain-containing protein [Burkholderiales bacterium]